MGIRKERERDVFPHSKPVFLSRARLLAIQALYQIDLSGQVPEHVILEYYTHHFSKGEDFYYEDKPQTRLDLEHFECLVKQVFAHQSRLDISISKRLKQGWELEQLDKVLLAVLRAASFELLVLTSIPVEVILDEYTNIAHDFFDKKETAFVNGILNGIAQDIRPDSVRP